MTEQELLVDCLQRLNGLSLLSPSDRQLGDAAGVWAVQGTALDTAYLERWAAVLGVTEWLQDIAAGRIRPKST